MWLAQNVPINVSAAIITTRKAGEPNVAAVNGRSNGATAAIAMLIRRMATSAGLNLIDSPKA